MTYKYSILAVDIEPTNEWKHPNLNEMICHNSEAIPWRQETR